ncbi:MAG: glutathione S-transferase N-terminal domain-containing protein, partial [Myxococcales bacterium]|nr:glutathione S-transferase N-terminal domain-containing protein [Myxococcales bacterium]
MSPTVLFGSPLSPFVDKVQRALRLKKIEYEIVGPKGPADIKRWNPQTRKMPVLELNGERTIDSSLILDRLDQDFPEPPLLSRNPATRASQRLLEDWSDEGLYWYLMGLRWSEKNASASAKQISADAPALLRPLLARFLTRQLGGMTRAQGMGRLPADVGYTKGVPMGGDLRAAPSGGAPDFHQLLVLRLVQELVDDGVVELDFVGEIRRVQEPDQQTEGDAGGQKENRPSTAPFTGNETRSEKIDSRDHQHHGHEGGGVAAPVGLQGKDQVTP